MAGKAAGTGLWNWQLIGWSSGGPTGPVVSDYAESAVPDGSGASADAVVEGLSWCDSNDPCLLVSHLLNRLNSPE